MRHGWKNRNFRGETRLSEQYVQRIFDEKTLKSLVYEWMDSEDIEPANWTQRGIKSIAMHRLHQDFRLT